MIVFIDFKAMRVLLEAGLVSKTASCSHSQKTVAIKISVIYFVAWCIASGFSLIILVVEEPSITPFAPRFKRRFAMLFFPCRSLVVATACSEG